MNYKSKNIYYLFCLISSFLFFPRSVRSSFNILNCIGDIPDKIPCLIKAHTYKVDIKKIDICKKNPFPKSFNRPDFIRGECINLYDNLNNNFKSLNLDKKSKFAISEINGTLIQNGEFKFISMILKNKFILSGKYSHKGILYKTGSKGPNDIKLVKDKDKDKIPEKFSERFTNWRGKNNKDNKYCDGGGTFSRCDLSYNGFKIAAVGLNSDLIEMSGNKTKFLYYSSELFPPINLKDSKGFIDIQYIRNLEVYGDGNVLKSISIAPFLFKANYSDN